jgi:hypothetical protein
MQCGFFVTKKDCNMESKPRTFGDLLRQTPKPTITPPTPPRINAPRKETPKEAQATAPRRERNRKKPSIPTPPPPKIPFVNEFHRDHRARHRLHIAQLDATHYQVWGGKDPHTLTVADGLVTCDCQSAQHGSPCSHVSKYMQVIEMGIGELEAAHE